MRLAHSIRPRWVVAPVVFLIALAVAIAALKAVNAPAWLSAPISAGLALVSDQVVKPLLARRRRWQDEDLEAVELLRRHIGRQDRLPKIGEATARALKLRVHPAIAMNRATTSYELVSTYPSTGDASARPDAVDPDLPLFVKRDKAEELCVWFSQARSDGGFLVLVGNSSVGKTRLLYELTRSSLAGFAVLVPALGDGDLINKVAQATFTLPPLLVWLDELERFVVGPYLTSGSTAITAGTINRLLDAATPVVIVGTLWPDHVAQLRAGELDSKTQRTRYFYPETVDILDDRRLRQVSLDGFSPNERISAAHLASHDDRLARALADRDYNVTEVLAGVPTIDARYDNATEELSALLNAASDARRLGVQEPLTARLLVETARPYLVTVHIDDQWFDLALREATRRDRGAAPLIPLLSDDRRHIVGYGLTDHLFATPHAKAAPRARAAIELEIVGDKRPRPDRLAPARGKCRTAPALWDRRGSISAAR
jgi:hypothetical protein